MDEPERDESEAVAGEVEDLDLQPDQAEDVKGGTGGGVAPIGPHGPGG